MDEEMHYVMMGNQGEEQIELAFQELLTHYLASRHRKRIEIIQRAFNFANQAHRGIKRPNGEPYMLHPIAVARIVCDEIGLGSTSIASALLHDVIEDTDYTTEDIENIFGPKIAQIVDGLNKISGGIFGEQASTQAESLKELLLTMSADIRVILIKMADRLHNMRTLDVQPAAKQMKIAGETLYLYAPMAERLGLYKIKTELENLSFRYEHPEECRSIEERINETAAQREGVFRQFTAPIRAELDRMQIGYRMTARVKSAYSIWHKMQTKHVSFDEVYDLLAVRIIFTPTSPEQELNECFDIYVALTKLYKSHPDRLRDWVNHPKANGYQALHVTLMSGSGQWIEVQIRSERMHEIAEQGLAAHWKYKDGEGHGSAADEHSDEDDLNKWLLAIKDILDDPGPEAIDFLDTIKLNLFASEIFVFTPKGDLKTVPQGSTVLDFAFYLHTDIGTHCIGAKVNHKLVPLSHVLQSGDQVEIITSRSGKVKPEWIDYASTARARAKITSILRRETKAHKLEGERLLAEFLQHEGGRPDDKTVDRLARLHHYHTRDELLVAIGDGSLTLGDAERNVLKNKSGGWKNLFKKSGDEAKATPTEDEPTQVDTNQVLKLTEEKIAHDYRMAPCCQPIPGDEVLGYVDETGQVIIHKRRCPVAIRLKSNYGRRIIAARWDTHKNLTFPANIYIKGIDCVGLINQVTQVISCRLNVNIRKLSIEAGDGIFEGRISLQVHDVDDVRQICNALKQIANIKQVERTSGSE